MARQARQGPFLDTELEHLPPALRWREWMGRVEAVIFASAEPVPRETLAQLVGKDCSIDLLIDDIRNELHDRPYELVTVAGGWQHRTRRAFGDAVRLAAGQADSTHALTQTESLVLMCIAYFQPITRSELSRFFGKEISRDLMGMLRSIGFIAAGPRSPQAGAPYTYVTTREFLSHFGFDTLRDLPNIEALEDAGLLNKAKMFSDIPDVLGALGGEAEDETATLEIRV